MSCVWDLWSNWYCCLSGLVVSLVIMYFFFSVEGRCAMCGGWVCVGVRGGGGWVEGGGGGEGGGGRGPGLSSHNFALRLWKGTGSLRHLKSTSNLVCGRADTMCCMEQPPHILSRTETAVPQHPLSVLARARTAGSNCCSPGQGRVRRGCSLSHVRRALLAVH